MIEATKSIGIIGAGKLGITLAQLALGAGYDTYIAGSGDPSKIALSVEVLAPGAVVMTRKEVSSRGDIIILALPLSKYRSLSSVALKGKLVIDATNHWWEIDGDRDGILNSSVSSSEEIQTYLPDSRVVKALNHMGYHHLHDEHRPVGANERKAIALAGDNAPDIETVSRLIDSLGFDPVFIGDLSMGRKLEPGGNVFGANVTVEKLRDLLAR